MCFFRQTIAIIVIMRATITAAATPNAMYMSGMKQEGMTFENLLSMIVFFKKNKIDIMRIIGLHMHGNA